MRKLKRIPTLEFVCFMLATIAGLLIFSRIIKACMGTSEYFKGLDRECNILFGAKEDLINDQQFQQEVKAQEM